MKIEFNGSIEEYKKFLNTEIERINKESSNEYIDLGLPSGTLWAKCNIGAELEEEYGDYLTWEKANTKYNLPTKEQFEELHKECTWKWCTINLHNGYLVIGKNGNFIFLPAAGYCDDALILEECSNGGYWSSTLNTTGISYYLSFGLSYVNPSDRSNHYYGFTVRPVK